MIDVPKELDELTFSGDEPMVVREPSESQTTAKFGENLDLPKKDQPNLEGFISLRTTTTESAWLTAYPLKLGGVEWAPCRAVVKVPTRSLRVGHSG